ETPLCTNAIEFFLRDLGFAHHQIDWITGCGLHDAERQQCDQEENNHSLHDPLNHIRKHAQASNSIRSSDTDEGMIMHHSPVRKVSIARWLLLDPIFVGFLVD